MEIRKSGRYPAEKDDVVAVLGGAGRVRLRFCVSPSPAHAPAWAVMSARTTPVTAAGLRYFARKKSQELQNEVLAVWEETEPMSYAYKQIDELSLRRKRNLRPWPYLPP